MLIKIANCEPRKLTALGASLGEQHMATLQEQIADGSLLAGTTVIMDFEGVQAVNASYIKATVYRIFLCGKMSTGRVDRDHLPRHPADPRPYDVFVAVASLEPEVEEEFIDFFRSRQAPLLIAKNRGDDSILSALLEGYLEPTLKKTLAALLAGRGGSAPQLFSAHPEEKISVTAWNNRLSDLHALRLVRRARAGKAWEYTAIAPKIDYGRRLH